ncbi:hypothetical protein EBZ35_04175 [bacterium]|nr:hypothetical protein [bacterium]
MIKWVLGLAFLLLGVEMSYAQPWINTNATTRSFRTVSSTHNYAIAPGLTATARSSGDIIYVAVVGGSDSSDTIISPTYNTPSFLATLATVNAIAPTSWGTGTVAIQSITLNAVLKITVRQAASVATVNSFLSQLLLKTMAYRQDKTIAFILDRTDSPEWQCFNARTVSVNFNIQCSTTHVSATLQDADNGIDPQDLVSFSPNEFLAFASSSTPRASNTCPFSQYEKELHSTHQTMAQSNQILQFTSSSTISLSIESVCGLNKEYNTANQDIDPSTIYARMVIMRPNPFLHAQPF